LAADLSVAKYYILQTQFLIGWQS